MNYDEELFILNRAIGELRMMQTLVRVHGIGMKMDDLVKLASDAERPIHLIERHTARLKIQSEKQNRPTDL